MIRIPLDMAQGNFSAELDISRARREWATEQLANPNGDWDAAINAYQHPLQGMDATINLLTETMLATAGNIGNVGLTERVFVGGMAREVTAAPAMTGFFWFMRKKAPGGVGARFADNAKLQDHFTRHGSDFGASSAAQYQRLADDFLTGPRGSGVLEKVRPNGDVVRFNPATNEFGVVSGNGIIRTYYKPDPAVHGHATNLDYFNAQ